MEISATVAPVSHAAPDSVVGVQRDDRTRSCTLPSGGPLDQLQGLRRTRSATAALAELPTPAPRLDMLFGSAQPARGKILDTEHGVVHRTPIQKQEIEDLGQGQARVKINPTRLFVSTAPALEGAHSADASTLAARFDMRHDEIDTIRRTPTFHAQNDMDAAHTAQRPLAQRLRLDDLRDKKVEYKWNIAKNGSLVIGEVHPGVALDEPMTTKQARKKKQPFAQGHVTLIGGQPWQQPWQSNRLVPEARICGTLYYDDRGELSIDNDSGRFSEYADRTPQHLAQVAEIFRQYGLPVKEDWLTKPRVPLQNPSPPSHDAATAARGADDVAQNV
ncbi:XopV/AopV family type III secretion system effector [Sphingomonas sp. NCPPB 2930]